MTQSIEKRFLIDPLTTNNAIYRDSLTFKKRRLYQTTSTNQNFIICCRHFLFLFLTCDILVTSFLGDGLIV